MAGRISIFRALFAHSNIEILYLSFKQKKILYLRLNTKPERRRDSTVTTANHFCVNIRQVKVQKCIRFLKEKKKGVGTAVTRIQGELLAPDPEVPEDSGKLGWSIHPWRPLWSLTAPLSSSSLLSTALTVRASTRGVPLPEHSRGAILPARSGSDARRWERTGETWHCCAMLFRGMAPRRAGWLAPDAAASMMSGRG